MRQLKIIAKKIGKIFESVPNSKWKTHATPLYTQVSRN